MCSAECSFNNNGSIKNIHRHLQAKKTLGVFFNKISVSVSFDLIQALGHVLQKTERMQNNILQNLAQPLWRNLKISYLKNITVTKLLQFNKSSLLTTFITCLSRLAESWQTCLYLTCTLNINMLNININTAIFASSIHMKASAMNELPEIEYPCFSQRVNDRGVNIASHQRKSKAKSVILNGFG